MKPHLDYSQDHTKLILQQLKAQDPTFLQLNYLQRSMVEFNPETAQIHIKSAEEENIKEYIEDTARDRSKYLQYQHQIKSQFFHLKSKQPPGFVTEEKEREKERGKEPIEMIKSYSQPRNFYKRMGRGSMGESQLAGSMASCRSLRQKDRYSEEVQHLLNGSLQLTKKENRFKLRGGTIREKEKQAERIMKEERHQILNLIQSNSHQHRSTPRPEHVDEITNKEKYSLTFLDYMKQKTKERLEKNCYERRVRKPVNGLEKFQEFILEEGKFKPEAKERLSEFYLKMRQQFRRIEQNHARSELLLQNSKKRIKRY